MSNLENVLEPLDVDSPGPESLKFAEFLRKYIRGQDDAIKDIADAIEISKASLEEEDKPLYKGFFMGPSGVAKTYLVEKTAEYKFGSMKALTRVACESYSESHSISRLIGSPAGYVGYGDPPILSQGNIDKWAIQAGAAKNPMIASLKNAEDTLREYESEVWRLINKRYYSNPMKMFVGELAAIDQRIMYISIERIKLLGKIDAIRRSLQESGIKGTILESVILFDEIEKASPALWNIILNILDKATLTLANGTETNFRGSTIIMTSNVNSRVIAALISKKRKLGFNTPTQQMNPANLDKLIYDKSIKAAEDTFPAEFIPRCGRISVFRPLSEETLWEIFNIQLEAFEEKHLKPLLVTLNIEEVAKRFIVREATDKPQQGARLLKAKIDKYLKKQIARLKNRKVLQVGDTLHVKMAKNGRKLEFYRSSPPIITAKKELVPIK